MAMLKIDLHKSWISLKEKADKIFNEKHKILLNEVANHMEAEIKGQLDLLMSTLTAEPVYHFWRVSDVNMILNGYEEVSGFYSNMFQNGGEQFEVVTKRIIVNDDGVITEGKVKQVYTKDNLKLMGLTKDTFSEIDNSDLWLSNTQLITVWPSDPDLKLVGEDIYFGENPMETLKPINENEIPDYYKIN
jgi:hypothetical protein